MPVSRLAGLGAVLLAVCTASCTTETRLEDEVVVEQAPTLTRFAQIE